jgi:uroporphyrinogen decarboxylase
LAGADFRTTKKASSLYSKKGTKVLSRERVIQTINHQKPDRTPIYGWVSANLSEQINESFGSVAAFEDKYEFDLAHLFGGPPTFDPDTIAQRSSNLGRPIEPSDMRDVAMTDPNIASDYGSVTDAVRHHKEQRARFVYMQTPGFFEAMNGIFGIENHLAYLLLYPDDIHALYARQAQWNIDFAMNCIDLGVDMIHISDDWGAQSGLMFSPKVWWEMIYPYHKQVADAVKSRGCYLSLHSDGNVMSVLDGIVQLGFDVVHPYQESAGMDYSIYRRNYMDKFTIMGGLDVQTTIGFDNYDHLKSEIKRVLEMFKDGGLLYCTTHFVQDHCTIEELTAAYDLIYSTVRK